MGPRSVLCGRAVLALILIALALGAAGCGGPKLRADQVVGKWRVADSRSKDIVLDLEPDGTGTSRMLRYPHEQTIRWSLEGSDLVTASMDGTMTIHYRCRPAGSDQLVLTAKTGELALARVK